MQPVAGFDDSAWDVPSYDTIFSSAPGHRHCVVVPVINEGERIGRLLQRMATSDIARQADILIVDGGSNDGSLEPCRLQDHGVSTLIRKSGPGRLSAQLRCAYAHAIRAGYSAVITIDGNDKDDPAAIPSFIAKLDDGYDFVQASRYHRGGVAENTPLVRNLAIRCVHAPLTSLAAGFRWTDSTQGFRGYSRRMLLDPRIAPFRDVFMDYELLAYLSCRSPRLGFRCIEIPTARRYPVGQVPTKISSVRGNLAVLVTLLRACAGRFNPEATP
jgi:dolichol-phosphate mannosyltransferase